MHVLPSPLAPNGFQHLMAASVLGGFNARPKVILKYCNSFKVVFCKWVSCLFKPIAPRFMRLVSTGSVPYVGVYDHILESGDAYSGPNLAKMASNYANRLKSSFWSASSSWIYGKTGE